MLPTSLADGHYYDKEFGQCLRVEDDPIRVIAWHGARGNPQRRRSSVRELRRWKDARIRNELWWHVLHAFGAIDWRFQR